MSCAPASLSHHIQPPSTHAAAPVASCVREKKEEEISCEFVSAFHYPPLSLTLSPPSSPHFPKPHPHHAVPYDVAVAHDYGRRRPVLAAIAAAAPPPLWPRHNLSKCGLDPRPIFPERLFRRFPPPRWRHWLDRRSLARCGAVVVLRDGFRLSMS